MNNKNISRGLLILFIGSIYLIGFGIHSISVLHYFVNGLMITCLGVLVFLLWLVVYLDWKRG